MTLSDRDKKLVLILIPVAVLAGYWFLLLGPKRKEASKAGDQLAKAERKRDRAKAKLAEYQAAKASFAEDYTELVRLGKAIPSSVDMPSLIVQLDESAEGTGIRFTKISTSQEGGAGGSGGSAAPQPPNAPKGNAAPGGAPAGTGPGRAAEKAGNATNNANGASSNREAAAQSAGGSSNGGGGGVPVGGGSAGGASSAGGDTACAPGLECVPLTFEFRGDFFRLADFFHRLKRFVRVANDRIGVHGRLLTIDGVKFTGEDFPRIFAEVKASVYLAPKAQGPTAGASPSGPNPAPATPTGGGQAPDTATPAPAATATP